MNDSAERIHDEQQAARDALVPTGEAREQWIFEHIAKVLESGDTRRFEDELVDCVIFHAKEIGGYISTFDTVNLHSYMFAGMHARLRKSAIEAFADHDWEADERAKRGDRNG